MKTRAKAAQTQDRIMEIVVFLLKRIIASPDAICGESELVRSLEQKGYGRAEIDAAIELVFTVPEIINSADHRADPHGDPTTRVFSQAEELKLGISVRSRLLQYRSLGLLTESEWEEVLMHLLLSEMREAGLADLYAAVRKVIHDEQRLLFLLPDPALPATLTVN